MTFINLYVATITSEKALRARRYTNNATDDNITSPNISLS